jgi:hypothetical protein
MLPNNVLPDSALPELCIEPATYATSNRYDSTTFYGIVIDTGVSKFSTAGFDQFQAL